MSGCNKYLKKFAVLVLMIAATVLVDRFFIQGVISLPSSPSIPTEEVASGRKIYTYKFYPFNEFLGEKPDFPFERDWIFSHPIGIGMFDKIISIEIPNPQDYREVQYRAIFNFSDGYRKSIFWERLEYSEGRFNVKTKRNCPFMQLRLKTNDGIRKIPSWIIVRIESQAPIGLLGISGIDAENALKKGDRAAGTSEFISLDRHFFERPVRTVKIDTSFDTYRSINILNGLNCNIIGEINFEILDLSEAMESVKYYGDMVRIWKLTGTANTTRDSAETVALSICKNSPSSIILWENEGLLSDAESGFGDKEWSPVKLDRGTLWTGVIMFSLLFLIIGTIKIFKLGMKIEFINIIRYLKFIPALAVVFLLPLAAEGFNISISLFSLKIIGLGSVSVFLIEFVRCFFLSGAESILNLNMKMYKKRNLPIRLYSIIFLSALLTSFLFAGYPGFSSAGSLLLIISNFVAGFFLSYLFVKENSLTLNVIMHLISILPFLIMIGK
jgi:hypothetical protein